MRITLSLALVGLLAGMACIVSGQLLAQFRFIGSVSAVTFGMGVALFSCVFYLIALLYYLFLNPSPLPANMVAIVSSKGTLVVKFFLPYYFFACWALSSSLFYFSPYTKELFLPNFVFFALLTGVATAAARFVTNVFVTKDAVLMISNYWDYRAPTPLTDVIRRDDFKVVSRLKTQSQTFWYLKPLF